MKEKLKSISRQFPSKNELSDALGTFGTIERLVFIIALTIAGISAIIIADGVNNHFMTKVPADGGTLHEGIIGTPRFLNPLLATTDADRDITELVYRGLVKKDAYGNIVPDLAESFEISDDGLTYTFILKNARFHDNTPVTADDVVYTIKSVQDITLKSIHRIEWEGVTARATDPKTIVFTLKNPYAPFIESATLGILPKHIWSKIPYENWVYSDFGTSRAVGAGPYKIKSVSEDSSGIPNQYILTAFRGSVQEPRISTIALHFYPNEESLVNAYKKGDINSLAGISPENAELIAKDSKILVSPLPRVFGLFFNQNQAKIFTDKAVRQAIDEAIHKDDIVQDVLLGYGHTITSPIVLHTESIRASESHDEDLLPSDISAEAMAILEKAGWSKNDDGIYQKKSGKEVLTLAFEIATSDVPELKHAGEIIAENLRAIGMDVSLKVYEVGSLNQDVIRPRKFQALFFGEAVGTQSDLFAFWHSSQRNDPGLNISGYANTKTDTILEKLLKTTDPENRDILYGQFEKEITSDIPASFIYAPSFIYVVRKDMTGITLGVTTHPEDRFMSIEDWYLDTDNVWKLFIKK